MLAFLSSTAKQDKSNGMKHKTFSLNFLSKEIFLLFYSFRFLSGKGRTMKILFLFHNSIHEKKIRFDGKKLFMTFLGRNIVWIKFIFFSSLISIHNHINIQINENVLLLLISREIRWFLFFTFLIILKFTYLYRN